MDARRILSVLLIGSFLGLAAAPATGAAADRGVPAEVDEFLEGQMSRHGIPGLSVAIIENGAVTYRQGYGEAAPGRPMTADTPQPIGSISKTVTATAVLQLVEDGLINLDEPVRTYLPEFTVADAQASREVTVRQLMEHTSGLSDAGYNRVLDPSTTLAEGVRDLRHAEVSAPPGTKHQYFNPNYSVLGLLIERVTESTYRDVVAKRIFEPLDMTRSTADYAAAGDAVAQGHTKLFGFAVPMDSPFRPYGVGYGYVISTATDLARFAVAVGLPAAESPRVLNALTLAQMHKPADVPDTGYGFGWETHSHHGEPVGGHDGLDPSFMGQMAVLPDSETGYVLLVNEGHLLDAMIAMPQIRAGMLDLLQGRSAETTGLSMRIVGAVLLVVLVISIFFAVRSALRLRGWPHRSLSMTGRQLARAIAPHVLVPALVLVLLYYGSPLLMGGRGFNVRDIGLHFMPDVLILLALAVVPDAMKELRVGPRSADPPLGCWRFSTSIDEGGPRWKRMTGSSTSGSTCIAAAVSSCVPPAPAMCWRRSRSPTRRWRWRR
jgi:CubicO group peptidase (beta-lactamase class C family)